MDEPGAVRMVTLSPGLIDGPGAVQTFQTPLSTISYRREGALPITGNAVVLTS